MKLTRREMLRGGLSALGFLALPGGLWAAPAGFKPKKKPNLVFGAVSDTHVRSDYDGAVLYGRKGTLRVEAGKLILSIKSTGLMVIFR